MKRKYDTSEIMKCVGERCKKGDTVRHMKKKHEMTLEAEKLKSQMDKQKLKVHEDRERRRMQGLEKARKARKKKAK